MFNFGGKINCNYCTREHSNMSNQFYISRITLSFAKMYQFVLLEFLSSVKMNRIMHLMSAHFEIILVFIIVLIL